MKIELQDCESIPRPKNDAENDEANSEDDEDDEDMDDDEEQEEKSPKVRKPKPSAMAGLACSMKDLANKKIVNGFNNRDFMGEF